MLCCPIIAAGQLVLPGTVPSTKKKKDKEQCKKNFFWMMERHEVKKEG